MDASGGSYQQELAESGKRLFFVRGTFIYIVIAIATLIAFLRRDMGPFSTEAHDRLWFWLSLAVATTGAGIRVITSGFAALGTSGRAKVAAEAVQESECHFGKRTLDMHFTCCGRHALFFNQLTWMTPTPIPSVVYFDNISYLSFFIFSGNADHFLQTTPVLATCIDLRWFCGSQGLRPDRSRRRWLPGRFDKPKDVV